MTTKAEFASVVRGDDKAETLRAALAALALGAGVLFMIGFAHSSEIHNAAHDTRHALSFPCH